MNEEQECLCNWCVVHGTSRLAKFVWEWLCSVGNAIVKLPSAIWKATKDVFSS